MKYLSYLALVIKYLAFLIFAAVVGYIAGDELEQRKLRADLRAVCTEQFVERMGEPENELAELIVKYQCRNAIP